VNYRPVKWYYWVLLALLVKAVMFFFLTAELGSGTDRFIGISGGDSGSDTPSYLESIENLISKGFYSPDYRMPGYAVLYYLLRLAFDIVTTNNLIVIIQSLLGAISVYLLAETAFRLFRSVRMFYLVYFTFLISTYTQIFDLYLLTESLCVSTSIFAFYCLVKGLQENKNSNLFDAGFFTTWTIFLRPVYAPYLFFFAAIIIIYKFRKKVIKKTKIVLAMLVFMTPFVIADGAWMIRNYKNYGKIQPLTKSVYYPDALDSYFMNLLQFLQSWGGSYIFWDPSSEIRLLGYGNLNYGPKFETGKDAEIPHSIYTSEFNADSLQLIRSYVERLQNHSYSEDSVAVVNTILKEKLDRYTLSVRREHPFTYQVTARLKYFRIFLLHSGTYNLMQHSWSELSLIKKLIKICYSALYIFIVIIGIIGSVYLFLKSKNILQWIVPILTLYCMIIFPWIMRLPEMRYFAPTYPFMIICAMYVTNVIINRFRPELSEVKPVEYEKTEYR
jgi:hypothetical protein